MFKNFNNRYYDKITMSHNQSIPQDFKTIRLPATTYYKIIEMSALVALIRGESTSISEVVSSLVISTYQYLYPWLLNVANDPKQREQLRNQFLTQKKTLEELMKDVRLIE